MLQKKIALALILVILTTFPSCLCREKGQRTSSNKKVELTYYKLFEDEDVIRPMIQEFQSKYPQIRISYRKFVEPREYEDLIINELAEGEGPDIFAIHNTWVTKHAGKINPVPESVMTPEQFQQTFVNVAAEDFIRPDKEGNFKIYGLPLAVDTLALYYNQDHFEDKIPSQGRPSITWAGIKNDVSKLNKKDNSFERFKVAGIALGRADNILRDVDILNLMMLQYKTQFYADEFDRAIFADSQGVNSLGQIRYPGSDALKLYTGFALPNNKHFSWNQALADPESSEKELTAFAKGKVSMIIGYSYLYDDLQNLIQVYDQEGIQHIDADSIKIAPIPQVYDPTKTSEKRDTLASYFAETVSRTSQHPTEAWTFLKFITNKENQQHYFEKTHYPTSRRDLIDDQKKDPVYGVFVDQIGYAESILMADYYKYKDVFREAIQTVIEGQKTPESALRKAQEAITTAIPKKGLLPKFSLSSTHDQ